MGNKDYNLNDDQDLPLDNIDKNSFGLPFDYFSSFENRLKQKLELQDELEQYSVLSAIQKNNAFAVPINYFKETEHTLEVKSELGLYTKLQSYKTFEYLQLSNDYINHLNSSVNYKIDLIDELKEYKILYSIDKVNSFIVSDTYYETLAERVKEKIHIFKETKISVLDSILNYIFGKKMAFAFGLVTIISFSVYFYESPKNPFEKLDCKTLACLERQEILNNTKVISNFDDEQLIDMVDVNKLHQQLKSEKKKITPSLNKINVDSISEDDLLDEL